MAKKLDRFGWDRDRGKPAHDRMVADWMDALQDYPLEEVQEACRVFTRRSPGKMPNEGHILTLIQADRKLQLERYRASQHRKVEAESERGPPASKEARERIMALAGYSGAEGSLSSAKGV